MIEWKKIKVSEIVPNPDNPRVLKDESFHKLVESLRGFPEMLQIRPIVLNRHNMVLGGNQRLRAVQDLGWSEIPIVYAESLTEQQQKEFIVKDNLSSGEWDWNLLQSEWNIDELKDWGLDIPEMKTIEEAKEDDYEIPDEIKTDIVLGDLFEIGEHRLMCGDGTLFDHVSKLMDGKKANMVFTDPPYGVSYTGGLKVGLNGIEKNKREMIKNDDTDIYEDAVVMCDMFCDGPVFMFYADTVPFGIYRGVKNVNGQVIALLIWEKPGGYGALSASYKPNHEPCLLWKTKGSKLNFIGNSDENRIWKIKKDGINKFHPTQKPVEIAARALSNHSANLILDLFLGSGTTMVAAHQLNRKCYGMELDPKYCQVILNRMKALDPSLQIKRNGQSYTFPE